MHMRLSLAAALSFALASTSGAAAQRYSDWSTPTLFDEVNTTTALEFANAISKDGLSFYFQRGDSTATDFAKREDIWVAHREHKSDPWGTPEKLPDTVNSPYNDRAAFVSADGHWLFFASDRPGGRGGSDLMVSWREHVHDDFDWQEARNIDDLGSPVNTPGFDSGPAIFEDEESGLTYLYFVSNPAGPQNNFVDIYVSIRNPDGSFGAPTKVEELSDPSANEGRPYLSHNGLEIFFQSNRAGSLGTDIWTSTRATTQDPWSTPTRVEELSTAGGDVTPALSWDGETLYFARRPAATSDAQIYFSTREKLHGKSGN